MSRTVLHTVCPQEWLQVTAFASNCPAPAAERPRRVQTDSVATMPLSMASAGKGKSKSQIMKTSNTTSNTRHIENWERKILLTAQEQAIADLKAQQLKDGTHYEQDERYVENERTDSHFDNKRNRQRARGLADDSITLTGIDVNTQRRTAAYALL